MTKGNQAYRTILPKILAVDFDGTLVSDKFPDIGEPNWNIVNKVKMAKAVGYKLVLWTCRDNDNGGDNLSRAVEYCKLDLGLEFDAVNQNIKEVQEIFNNDTRKVYADWYLDDKSIYSVDLPYKDVTECL